VNNELVLLSAISFSGIPDSRAGIHDIPDDLEDMKIRPKSSSNRRHRKVKISVEVILHEFNFLFHIAHLVTLQRRCGHLKPKEC